MPSPLAARRLALTAALLAVAAGAAGCAGGGAAGVGTRAAGASTTASERVETEQPRTERVRRIELRLPHPTAPTLAPTPDPAATPRTAAPAASVSWASLGACVCRADGRPCPTGSRDPGDCDPGESPGDTLLALGGGGILPVGLAHPDRIPNTRPVNAPGSRGREVAMRDGESDGAGGAGGGGELSEILAALRAGRLPPGSSVVLEERETVVGPGGGRTERSVEQTGPSIESGSADGGGATLGADLGTGTLPLPWGEWGGAEAGRSAAGVKAKLRAPRTPQVAGWSVLHVIGGLVMAAAIVPVLVPPRRWGTAVTIAAVGLAIVLSGVLVTRYPWVALLAAGLLVAVVGWLGYQAWRSGRRGLALEAIVPVIEEATAYPDATTAAIKPQIEQHAKDLGDDLSVRREVRAVKRAVGVGGVSDAGGVRRVGAQG